MEVAEVFSLRASNKTPARRACQASVLLLRCYDATDFLQLAAHCPNGASRDVARIGKPFANDYSGVIRLWGRIGFAVGSIPLRLTTPRHSSRRGSPGGISQAASASFRAHQ